MNQLTICDRPKNPYLSEQRKIQRYEVLNLLAITGRGTGQILNISREGLSFGCLYPHAFPHEFFLDILDAKGSHIKTLKVRKIWETNGDFQELTAIYELVVAVKFSELTSTQSGELNSLLDGLELIDCSCSPMI